MNMNLRQARVIDPILSQHARGYQNAEFVGSHIAPVVPVPVRGFNVLKFNKDAFRRRNTRRAPGAATLRVQYGYGADPAELRQHRLEAVSPNEFAEEAAATTGIDFAGESIQMVQDVIGLETECEIASILCNPANYPTTHKLTLSGTAQWNKTASTPGKNVDDAKETVRRAIGKRPNVLLLAPGAFRAARNHDSIIERFKYTGRDAITAEMLAALWELDEVIVGDAVYLLEDDQEDAAARDVWDNVAILAYRPEGSSYRQPGFAYTYRKRGYPLVEKGYEDRNANSQINPVADEVRPYLVGPDAGFLFTNVTGA